MSRLEASDIKELGLLKHYRIIRRWACRNNNLPNIGSLFVDMVAI